MSSSGTCISTSGTLRFFFFLGLSFLPQPIILSSPVVLLLLADLSPFLFDDARRKSINPVNTIVVMPTALVPNRYKRSFRVTSDSGFVRLGRIPDSAALDSPDTCPPVSKHPTIGILPPRKSFCITRACITPPRCPNPLVDAGGLLPQTSQNASSPTSGEKGPVGREDGISVPDRVMASIVHGRSPLVL